jgi:predicted transposase YbfD/YdcC
VAACDIQKEWPSVQQICRVQRSRTTKKDGQWQEPVHETVYLITSLSKEEASPKNILEYNRAHWEIEIMHRTKDVFLREDDLTNRKDNAPQIMFSINNIVMKISQSVSKSFVKAREYFQLDINRAVDLVAGSH